MKPSMLFDLTRSPSTFDLARSRVKLRDHYRWLHAHWPRRRDENRALIYATLILRHGAEAVLNHCHQIAAVLDRAEEGR